MSENEMINKKQVSQWIKEIYPLCKNPTYLSPKGCFKGEQNVIAGRIIEYDASLMPNAPKVIDFVPLFTLLIELYKEVPEAPPERTVDAPKYFTREEIGKMSTEEFLSNEKEILAQLEQGLLK